MSRPPRDITEWMRFMEQEVKKAARSGHAALARELRSEMIKVREDIENAGVDTRQPAAPIEFTIQTSVLSNPRPYSQLSVNFSDVTVATDASAITVEKYELWGRDETTWNGTGTPPTYRLLETSATSDFFSEPYTPGSKWRIKARAIGEAMRMPGAWSAEFVVTMVADTTAPKIVPNPDLSQTLGVVTIKWDGLAADDTAMDPDFKYVEIAMGPASAPTDILPDTFTAAGSIQVTGLPYNEPRYFRMRSVDWTGNKSNWSGDSSITRQPLVSGDISGLDATIQAQTDRAVAAEEAALQAQADADTAAANASTSATQAAASQTAAQTAAAEAAASQTAADAAAAEAAQAEEAATAAREAAEAAEQKALEVAGLGGGQVWTQPTTPATGAVYKWTGTPRTSEAIKEVDGVEVRRNWLADSFESPNPAWGAWYVNGQQSLTVERSDEQAYVGTSSMKVTRSAAYASGAPQTSAAPGAAAVAGKEWTFKFMLYAPANMVGLTVGAYIRFEGTGGGSKTTNYVLTEGWNALSVTHTAGTGANGTINVQITTSNTFAQGMFFYADAISLEPGPLIEDYFDGDTLDDRHNDLWLDTDDGNKPYRWDDATGGWIESTDQAVIDASQAALAAEEAAAGSAASASAAQTNAQNAQNSASASATAANQAQAEAEAAEQAAAASQAAAAAAQAEAEQAAIDAGSSSAAALAAEQAAEAANLAADAARDEVDAYVRAGNTMIVNGNFDAPITSPPLGWPSRTLTYNEASTGTARSGTQVLRATPTTATIAYAYSDYYPAFTGQIVYVEYWVRLREALLSGNSTQQLGAYISARSVGGTSTVYSQFQNNGAPAVTFANLSTTTWTKVAVTCTIAAADIKEARFGPRISAVTTAGQNFEIDDFRVIDITEAQAALNAAAAAQTTANTANSAAGSAQSTANSALTAANGNSKLLFSTDPPSGTAPYGTIWFQIDNTGNVIGQWQQSAAGTASTWTKREIRSEVIANLDVGKLVGGYIAAGHIETATLLIGGVTLGSKVDTFDSWKSPSDTTFIDGGKLYTDSVKALQIDVNDLTADTAFIGNIRTTVLTADSVTATVLKSDAITSKHSITGALVQSTATASRGIKFTSSALTGYDGVGATMFSLNATTGKASIVGRVVTGASGEPGVGLIPSAESYNGKVAAVFFTRDGGFPGGNTGGMWVEDASVSTPMNVNIRGHYGGHVEIITGHLYVRGSGTRVGNFQNWALGDAANGSNYLPNLWINPASGTGYLRLSAAPTSSSAANAIIAVTPEGVLYRSTSALRYKADVQDWTPGLRALQLSPRSWVDRNPMDKADPYQRYYGMIAEEVQAVLPEIVTYNEFGEPDAIQYERLGVAIIEVLKHFEERITALEGTP